MFPTKRPTARQLGRARRLSKRRGVATVEFAFCVPVFIALTVGTIDLCSMLFLKESITLAAYEGARVGVGRGRTNDDVRNRVHAFLDERDIDYNASTAVQFSNTNFNNAETLENVTTTVFVPLAGNLLIPSAMFATGNLQADVTLRKEYKNLSSGS